jgi:uroporphyrinogen decarboxylase
MNSRERFLAACRNEKTGRPPVWVMRQAGRYLPEYRALKEKHTFLEMVKTPDLATEVTLQPMKRFALDAAIIFSDILIIPEAMGQPFEFRETGGIAMAYAVDTEEKVAKLATSDIAEKLKYVSEALKQTRVELGNDKALIGFGGSPWTLASYMVEGGSSSSYAVIKKMLYTRPELFDALLMKITDALIEYFHTQVDAGVDAIQIFDSWAGVLSDHTYWDASAKYIAKIIRALQGKVPLILYPKGAHAWTEALGKTGADVIGVDWTISIGRFYDSLEGACAVQGNLDPALMSTDPGIVSTEVSRILRDFNNRGGHIFNLGHGILPDAKIECMEALIESVHSFGT